MQVSYKEFVDRVKGCFLGKTVIGTLGAPYEGVKMPMNLQFKPEMIDTMLPNDDLDLQVLWLEVVEKKGFRFTSKDLLDSFCSNCDYSPGEYAIMRKNHEKGIMPPYSGSFCNDFYRCGNGCPIRSEIWACLSPGNPVQAAALSGRDGVIDHEGISIDAELFFAAVESLALCGKGGTGSFEDFAKLFSDCLRYVPRDSEVKEAVGFVTELCGRLGDIKEVLCEILARYGHLDCTNMIQNFAITIAALLKGEGDIIKTGMLALNCGFDTDCTCATAGAILGAIIGAEKLEEAYGWSDVKYVLGVNATRRSDKVSDLAEDVAMLAVALSRSGESDVEILEAPLAGVRKFEPDDPILFSVEYENGDPSFGTAKDVTVKLTFENTTDRTVYIDYALDMPANTTIKKRDEMLSSYGRTILPGDRTEEVFVLGMKDKTGVLYEKNIVKVKVGGDVSALFTFGISGNKIWRLTGPVWSTTPPTNDEILSRGKGYWHVFPQAKTEAESIDNVREFHLNFARDTQTDIFTMRELFEELPRGVNYKSGGTGVISRPYRVSDVETSEDSFRFSDFFGFNGPCVIYLSQILVSPEDMTVFAMLGCTGPFKFFVNGELIGERHEATTFDAENAHFEGVRLRKGENRIVLRLTRLNEDAKYSLIFSKGLTCSTHHTCFGTKLI